MESSTLRRPFLVWVMLFASTIVGCSDSETISTTEVEPKLAVEALQLVQADHYNVKREYVGIIKAAQKANLGFELAGKISAIYVDVGDHVEKGQALLTLDTELLKTEANQLKARDKELNARLNLVKANLKRQQALKASGFSAEAEMDALDSEVSVLTSSLLGLKSSQNANQLRQQKSTIRAPFSGIISHRLVTTGDVVNVGKPTLTLLSNQAKEAAIGIPAKQLSKVSALTSPQIRVGQATYSATLVNPGAIVDIHSRSVGLRYLLPNNLGLLEGQLAYLDFDEKYHKTGFWVPISALTDGMRGVWNVYIINDNQTIESRTIQVLFADQNKAYVQGAIHAGERIIASGLHRIVPGQQVSISQ
ncbi:efflux RND transporter periplasmic adaptor subunit [Vibrio methylphosphonaticus]|uniref:efflux RND transporter periplasmic adaptor subunit n=1 Tax=Vibrio methylphosphonaticus TaxID=2946866 RepID=UPI00202AB4FE|nr:efflux RND transporter periplasmic adaptor subunit [Vibrio methylphosphonaticus]MCL9774156.1 efflux RND transporter periplasmic adaptor subunit [Vibrio methylphosphonaticus]